jgi:pyrroloquinoline quinone (PQQ) biosynthesis protein C
MNTIAILKPSAPPRWVATLYEYVAPHWDTLVNGPWAESIAASRLSIEQMRGWILQLYPFIYDFPKFLAEGLIKVEDDFSRTFLIENIRIEKAHAEHWIWMGEGFGLTRQQMLSLAEGDTPVMRDVQSLTDWMWRVNTKGSLAEAVAATSFAVEGVAGALARKVAAGFEAYRGQPGVDMNPKTYKWIREHAHYDDEHPKFALEIVKHYAVTERMQRQVMNAARRSLELLNLALLSSSRIALDGGEAASTVRLA